jgi:N-terminal C2 in EEIG1 and EHBP1 proteins
VINHKEKKVLGEAELNLSDYVENEEKLFKIPLSKCEDPDAFIEVGMKAYDAEEKETGRKTSTKKPKKQEEELTQDAV